MPSECMNELCVNKGTFEGEECPGSDDENHHCVHCGELWWIDKTYCCGICEGVWCPSWQHEFVWMNCPYNTNYYDIFSIGTDEGICPECFMKHKELHCTNPEKCSCGQNYNEFCRKREKLGN